MEPIISQPWPVDLETLGPEVEITETSMREILDEAEARQKEEADKAAQAKYDEHERRQQVARDNARREREEARISGKLSDEAQVFLDLGLKPKIKEAHDFAPVIREPIVQNLFFKDSLSWVAGESGTFKSFVTADLAFRYGQEDMDYHGMRMTSGRSLLVIAEGAASYADRKTAWEKEHGREVKNVSIYPAPLQLGDTLKEMPALISYLREESVAGRPFGLILFDTQAMCTVGMDENSSEMNLIVNVLHRIREVDGACVMTVHHFGKKKEAGMRGSTVLYAAADTVAVLKRADDEEAVKLSTAQADGGKQKDAVTKRDLLELDMKAHPVGEDYFGDAVFSLVPVSQDTPTTPPAADIPSAPERLPEATPKQMPYLRALTYFRHHGAGQTELAKRMNETANERITYPALVRSTMIGLEDKGLVELDKGKWRVTPIGASVILREEIERSGTEQAWSNRPYRRRPDLDQTDVLTDVFETPEKTSD